ncbi:MAG: mechanosensitive ion channel family protein [Planctomycetota bacterium]|nr:mechanosensitive ion channel family protein [Planctomycetota bacterium]MDA1220883.1 mechanosensitive ion channel family protein [Planctomycetota bacterium]
MPTLRLLALFLLLLGSVVAAQGTQGLPATRTVPPVETKASDLVSVDVLRARLKPLTKAALTAELEGWFTLLQARVETVSVADVEVIETSGAAQADAGDRAAAARAERDAVVRRVRVVVDELGAKGGETGEVESYVTAVVGLPPVTGLQATWTTVLAWLRSPDGGVALAIDVGLALLILVAARIVSGILGGLLSRALGQLSQTSDLLRSFLVHTARRVVFLIGVVVALSQVGIDVTPFVAAIGAAGFVIGFALQGTLSNFAAGVMILIYRPYDIGDVVTAAGITGKVDSMTLVSTTIKTGDNQSIVVPNGSIWGGVITNITANPTRRIDMTFGIGYRDDIGRAKQILQELCAQHELVLGDPAPVIEVSALGASSVDLICRPWAKTGDYWTVFWDLTRQVKERFDREGISIPFPQQDVHIYRHEPA